ncbi:regulatory signaling modulator protein AmpE [Legionella oakridgensis]|uniref:Membrane protein required for beta-lactamase induction n=2 Tax=Legionella oakridgensis TaxID=29423 RepID=W0BFH4_9GAMM|nr:regulatory signaling modulator protein AmpE [Legionella oakridgensis]AHE67362.1 membrane protein required for beta-lactamase induction [Legionella oakridgensis ATCC 33761 = DSM 21215]ETO93025.1 membrane protein required for beta-lactamase induction [Legionella oakridgensis RV-2-2007]KTD43432.1 inner membrane protein AmpE [Legionella oakridgensis]STY20423.1 inner membrane protein AmpE [Legionella longbeachae]
MKLLIIVLCLLSERFLVHVSAHKRFYWFTSYFNAVIKLFPEHRMMINPWIMLILVLLPLLLATAIIFYFFEHFLFGFVGLLLSLIIFYYCLGPGHPFYPACSQSPESAIQDDVGNYLAEVNGQLFAVIFWYIILGPLGVLAYRLISLCRNQDKVQVQANYLAAVLDWVPARMTALLYLLVGHFQAGIHYFSNHVLTSPDNNQMMLKTCGLYAVDGDEQELLLMSKAETLVEHATIVLLVFLAFFTIAAWLS